MMKFLSYYGYTFVVLKEQRKSLKRLPFLPIDKIFNNRKEIIFNSSDTKHEGKEKARYNQILSTQIMMRELESCGFKLICSKPSSVPKNIQPLKKVKKIEYTTAEGENACYLMEDLENRIGKKINQFLVDKFNSSNSSQLIISNSNFP